MTKITKEFIESSFKEVVENYRRLTLEVGLWESEKYVVEKYFKPKDRIIDIGCGTGRTSFGMFRLGFHDIMGVDLVYEMIFEACRINEQVYRTDMYFLKRNVTKLGFYEGRFSAALFSFNGLMCVPDPADRNKAMQEIYRVLDPGSIFIFTTHDREKEEKYLDFWKAEKERWDKGEQRKDLYVFGDLITNSRNEKREIFIHIPNRQEIEDLIEQNNFKLLETFWRADKFDEPQKVKDMSSECRFWVVQKV